MTKLAYVDCGDNALDACALDKMYISLPTWGGTAADQMFSTLFNKGIKAEKFNKSAVSKSSIAVNKGWKPAEQGDGSGCAETSVAEIARGNGFNYYFHNGTLVVTLAAEYASATVEVYDLTGQCLARSTEGAERTFTLASGNYLLIINGVATKIGVE